MAANNTGMEPGENFVVVEPKLETENDGEGSGGSGDEEDWSDTDLGPPTPHPHSSQGETVPQTFASTTPFGRLFLLKHNFYRIGYHHYSYSSCAMGRKYS